MASSYSDDDDDEHHGMCTVLPVSDFTEYDPSRPPASGADYLRRVQLEAKKCPDLVVSDVDPLKFKDKQTPVSSDSRGFIKAIPELVPSVDEQHELVADFTLLRMKVEAKRQICEKSGLPVEATQLPSNPDHVWWRNYCLGKKTLVGSDDETSSSSDDETDTDKDVSEGQNGKTQQKKKLPSVHEAQPPLLSVLCQLGQIQTHKLLKYHIQWIKQLGFRNQNGLWIYSLLASLEKPLPSEIYSTLRDMSRVCSEVRSKLSADDELLRPLNLIICIIGRYFNQLDLLDDS